MAKYEVLRDCYGFMGRYWEKGDIVEIDSKNNPPHHFKLVSDSTIPSPEEKVPKPIELAELSRKELIARAKKLGIENAHMQSTKKLKEILEDSQVK